MSSVSSLFKVFQSAINARDWLPPSIADLDVFQGRARGRFPPVIAVPVVHGEERVAAPRGRRGRRRTPRPSFPSCPGRVCSSPASTRGRRQKSCSPPPSPPSAFPTRLRRLYNTLSSQGRCHPLRDLLPTTPPPRLLLLEEESCMTPPPIAEDS